MVSEQLTNCPFCGKLTIKILHIPFVVNKFSSGCRAGGKRTFVQEEKLNILSGCDECGKSQKEVEKALNDGTDKITHEERIRRIKESGLPTVMMVSMNLQNVVLIILSALKSLLLGRERQSGRRV